ncbi:peptidase inhibitor 16 [Pluvialis apricaria]
MLSSGLPPVFLLLTALELSWCLSDEEKKIILDGHNKYRSQVSPPAMDMLKMSWDTELEAFAQAYAEKCIWDHNKERGRRGENLFAMAPTLDLEFAVEDWNGEEKYYNLTTSTCVPGQMCGHYTQVVWASTHQIGCGAKFCEKIDGIDTEDMYLLVCNYYPPGNMKGRKPYKEGPSCSQCPEGRVCVNSLCEPTVEETTPASVTTKASPSTPTTAKPKPTTTAKPPPTTTLPTTTTAKPKPTTTLPTTTKAKPLPTTTLPTTAKPKPTTTAQLPTTMLATTTATKPPLTAMLPTTAKPKPITLAPITMTAKPKPATTLPTTTPAKPKPSTPAPTTTTAKPKPTVLTATVPKPTTTTATIKPTPTTPKPTTIITTTKPTPATTPTTAKPAPATTPTMAKPIPTTPKPTTTAKPPPTTPKPATTTTIAKPAPTTPKPTTTVAKPKPATATAKPTAPTPTSTTTAKPTPATASAKPKLTATTPAPTTTAKTQLKTATTTKPEPTETERPDPTEATELNLSFEPTLDLNYKVSPEVEVDTGEPVSPLTTEDPALLESMGTAFSPKSDPETNKGVKEDGKEQSAFSSPPPSLSQIVPEVKLGFNKAELITPSKSVVFGPEEPTFLRLTSSSKEKKGQSPAFQTSLSAGALDTEELETNSDQTSMDQPTAGAPSTCLGLSLFLLPSVILVGFLL